MSLIRPVTGFDLYLLAKYAPRRKPSPELPTRAQISAAIAFYREWTARGRW